MKTYFERTISAAPLAVFRIGLGFMLLFGVIRFWSKGWIEDLYINPKFYFPFYGFEFVVPLGNYTYVLFAVCGLSAFLFALGLYYRFASISLFLSFTYIELIDKSTYLNHYYFISMICLLMIFLPAHAFFSIDARLNKNILSGYIPAWTIDSIKVFVSMLYIFAAIAKINSDWLLHAQPLKIWLIARNDMPLIGFLFNYKWTPYLFSWFGFLYDLTIPFLLWNKKTRITAYAAVIVFHLMTSLLFPIGMFPYIMIVTALIFFSEDFHLKLLSKFNKLFKGSEGFISSSNSHTFKQLNQKVIIGLFTLFFFIQILLPFRYLLYPGQLFWTEEGFRFSWRVMLIEKAGYAEFKVRDAVSGKWVIVNNNEFLTKLQEKMMATQPDMILQYAHLLRDHYAKIGFEKPQVFVDSYVTLNGRLGRVLVDPNTDLAAQEESFNHKSWILSYND
ncbi:HTTM domain-containing protein [Sporocytophaga myxococcoides]|uniref:HTTM domain-containing protein n=1 Tax=Sporocytophaga myxococcoides TaxID=153721 RepID=UPI00040D4622|nr:HTTM domain-containing protein [Sporocytophaga myxococcoides]